MSKSQLARKVESIFEPISINDSSRKQVGAVLAAARITEMLCAENESLRMTTISRRLEIAPSSCFNILRTLTQEGIVAFDQKRKTYSIDVGLASIARGCLTPGGSLRVVGPLLEEFARSRQITIVVWRRVRHQMMVVAYFDSGSAVRVHIEVGARFPLFAGAMGRVMAAYGFHSARELNQHFSRVKWDRQISFNGFMAEAMTARKRGWAADPGVFNSGIHTISTPIEDGANEVTAVLSATMFAGQHDPKVVLEITEELCEIAKLLASVKIGRSFLS